MPRHYWEDFAPGQVSEYGPRRVTREEILSFARQYDPQPIHLDEAAARASMLGGLAASGFHGCCILMRMMSDGFLRDTSFMGAPGVESVKWLAPLRPDEELTARSTVLETRASNSRPDMGFVRTKFELIGAAGVPILEMVVNAMFGRRPAGREATARANTNGPAGREATARANTNGPAGREATARADAKETPS